MKSKVIILSPVRKVPLEEIAPGFISNSDITHAVIIKVGDTEKVVNFCSKNYEVLENELIIGLFQNTMKKQGFPQFKRTFSQWEWSRFYINYVFENSLFSIGSKKDRVAFRIQIVNSYDGKVRFQTNFGIWRQICSNGMMGWDKSRKFKLTHTPSIFGPNGLNDVMENFKSFTENSKEVLRPYRLLAEDTFSVKDLGTKVQEVIENTNFPKKQAESVVQRVHKEMELLDETHPNGWLLYNGFNYLLNHEKSEIKMDPERRHQLDANVLNYLIS